MKIDFLVVNGLLYSLLVEIKIQKFQLSITNYQNEYFFKMASIVLKMDVTLTVQIGCL
ncbi:hypothetical protein BGP_0768 [Beggiatoa sp. PS]|nr:hypothetical protein BGP_0768 [Beggiatoa sp. PS]